MTEQQTPYIEKAWVPFERLVAAEERIKLLEGVIERYALALMKIRTSQGEPIQLARDAMNAESH